MRRYRMTGQAIETADQSGRTFLLLLDLSSFFRHFYKGQIDKALQVSLLIWFEEVVQNNTLCTVYMATVFFADDIKIGSIPIIYE